MNLLRTLLAIVVISIFAMSFMTFDLASLSLDFRGSDLIRDNKLAVGIIGGILLIGLLSDRIFSDRELS
jgi:hypothetical protein